MTKCPNCKERPANFAFRNGANVTVNWCLECASKVANVFKSKEVNTEEPPKAQKA